MERCGEGVPEQLLERIGWQGSEAIRIKFVTVSGLMHAVNHYSIAVPQAIIPIHAHYQERCRQERWGFSERFSEIFDLLLWELLLNAAEHGNGWNHHLSIHVTMWLGDEGIVVGCRDEGDFFKQEEIKRRLEARERIRSHGKSGRGKGTSFICNNADEIEVDIKTGTIFLAVYFSKGGGTV